MRPPPSSAPSPLSPARCTALLMATLASPNGLLFREARWPDDYARVCDVRQPSSFVAQADSSGPMGRKLQMSEEEAFERRVAARLGSALRDQAVVLLALQPDAPGEPVLGTVDCIPLPQGKGRRALAPDLPARYLLRNLWVAPAMRRMGIARRLMAEAEALARSRHVTMLELEVMPGNGAARALYADLGFRPAEEAPAWMPAFLQGSIQLVKDVDVDAGY